MLETYIWKKGVYGAEAILINEDKKAYIAGATRSLPVDVYRGEVHTVPTRRELKRLEAYYRDVQGFTDYTSATYTDNYPKRLKAAGLA